ncbi:metal-binding protein [Thermosynechococcaceae cyanobacterium BACA0444]|uniref:Metal-binding protein n=1 Tax=Pseudocalidococcus azoricus BACA0444 TaxID=2918990 RepID=A0AAE4JW62_9CYAN|nr:metal-binding protein [Pseudocalidococcus azoricus]MDS3860726.1 metal-binding protein [Pseudocalidococcus azoricus BACA0444]
MPSGRVHDRVTVVLSPLAGLGAGVWGQRWELATLAIVGVLVSGFFLSPDLDILSKPYQRWGWLRWLWWPYQRFIPHRSWLSHGPIIGTVLRVAYLIGWLSLIGFGLSWVGQETGWWTWQWEATLAWLEKSWQQDNQAWIIGFVSLEIGAMGHYLSDFLGSVFKRSRPRKPHQA